ncbi:ankyrin repeat protein, putative [Trichomonas vaginalis G3]|uniref:Ankyrin repeat protein, putative n=1 Tax=Trichomonas vaginalis (strain ATCC PRA-98 / G3) TaxID=412133 RepID=A2D8D3_TRIV3|nr:temperature-gated cation channel protein [Trichomonas vaginalis G3]EAY23182.1 ankyrin repeat protein, putative [Trichomonas vaginalis G3]KAI5534197.1 temperature-gated cation channel protein [Trichomonas vaginalis G3]|eukprot:XP_001584168.1 ankyrin repeat protein [Trichomonas vaginalis G3]
MKKLGEEYHCDSDIYIRELSDFDIQLKNSVAQIIINDDEKELLNMMKQPNADRNRALRNCILFGAVNCFKLLRTQFQVQITKECLDDAFCRNNQYIIEECLKEQKHDLNTMKYAVISHNIKNVIKLMNEYNLTIPVETCIFNANFHAYLIYLNRTNDFNTCFVYSPYFNFEFLCEYLLSNGANINSVQEDGCSALHIAVKSNLTNIAKLLISKGIDVNIKSEHFGTALNFAIYLNNTGMVELLISNGAKIDIKSDFFNLISIHVGFMTNNYQVVHFIEKSSKQITGKRNQIGLTALFHTSLLNNKEMTQLLISHGANINITNKYGNNAISYALLRDYKKFMELYLNIIVSSFDLSEQYQNSLIMESKSNDIIELLISNGININAKNIHGNTPLHIAALLSNTEYAEILILHGAEINSLNKYGQTPLDIAVIRSKLEHRDFIKLHEGEKNFIQENGKDFFESLNEESEMESLLIAHGGKTANMGNLQRKGNFDIIFDYFFQNPIFGNKGITIDPKWIIFLIILKIIKRKINNGYGNRIIQILLWVVYGGLFENLISVIRDIWNMINYYLLQ